MTVTPSLQQAANLWLVKLEEGELSSAAIARLKRWLGSSMDNRKAFREASRCWLSLRMWSFTMQQNPCHVPNELVELIRELDTE